MPSGYITGVRQGQPHNTGRRDMATYTIKTEAGWQQIEAKSPQAIREEYRAKGVKVLAIIAGAKR